MLEENANLRAALATRPVIEQAKGVLMLRYRIPAETAYAVLRRWSQASNIKLRTIAQAVAQATARDEVTDHDENATEIDIPGLVRWLQQQLNRDSHDTAAAVGSTSEHLREDTAQPNH